MLVQERDPSALRTKHVYDQTKLKEIVNNYHLNKDYRYKRLPIEAIKTIRTLRLNRKRRRHRYTCQKRQHAQCIQHAHGSRPENLTKIKRKCHKNCSVSLKPRKPWFNKELAVEKAKVRRHEMKWLKYKLSSTWTAYKKIRNLYYAHLNNSKKKNIHEQIMDCSDDSKKLFSLVTNLTNKPEPQKWPKHKYQGRSSRGLCDFLSE